MLQLKIYVDKNNITTVGAFRSSDIQLSVVSDLTRTLGSTDLTPGEVFMLMLGTYLNLLEYAVAEPLQKPLPVSLNAEAGYNIVE